MHTLSEGCRQQTSQGLTNRHLTTKHPDPIPTRGRRLQEQSIMFLHQIRPHHQHLRHLRQRATNQTNNPSRSMLPKRSHKATPIRNPNQAPTPKSSQQPINNRQSTQEVPNPPQKAQAIGNTPPPPMHPNHSDVTAYYVYTSAHPAP